MLPKIVPVIGLISALETCAQGFLKYAFNNPATKYVGLLAPVVYSIICYALYRLYQFESMALINSWWNIITSLTVSLTGVFIFGETLKGFDILGLAFVIVGSFFLSIEDLGVL
jgi:multidrug transporter EmrE-like cation transporter